MGILDLCHLVVKHEGAVPAIVYYEESGFRFRLLEDMVRSAFTPDSTEEDVGVHFTQPGLWLFLNCRGDLEPGVQTANHFMPVWHKQQVGEVQFNLYKATLQAMLAQQKATLAEELMKVADMDEEDGDWASAMLASLLTSEKVLNAQEKMYKLMFDSDLVTMIVPGDGDCLLHSMAAQIAGPDSIIQTAGSDGKLHSRMENKKVRKDGRLGEVAGDHLWK